MLVIKILSTKKENYKGRFFQKQIRPDAFKRSCHNICGKTCTIMEFNESMLSTLNLERLLNTFKGQIIGPEDAVEKIVPEEFRYDYKPYFKRAILSSLLNNLGDCARNLSVCIRDKNFVFSNEYCNLANSVKSFTLITNENDDTGKFCNYCFVEWGNFINLTDDKKTNEDVFVNFDDIDINGKILIIKEGKEQLLYPDPRYFSVKEELIPLLNMGVHPKVACAAFNVIT